jgi:hypothetical protein
MSGSEFAWGAALIGAGVFISVYGTIHFRFALAARGFGVAFIAVTRIFDGPTSATHVLIAFAAGGVGLGAFFAKRMGAFTIVSGMQALFASSFQNEIADPASTLS